MLKRHQGPVFIDSLVNSIEVVVQEAFREGPQKSSVVPEFIDAVGKLILQDRNVTFRH